MTDELSAQRNRKPERPQFAFVIVMLALAAMLFALGFWQMQRLGQKEALIARIAERIDAPQRALPPVAEWPALDPDIWDYRPVEFSGRYVPGNTVLVFTSLPDPKGTYGGPGYWVMVPFAIDGGGYVFVNRGFVPQDKKAAFGRGGAVPTGPARLEGIARRSEIANAFTPGPDELNHIEWVRDIPRLAKMVDPALTPFIPLFVDLKAGDPGALPQGGETRLDIPNKHFGYALTWFGLGASVLVLLGIWFERRRRD